ncbi:MAG: ATP phosphoribosyltransferase [Coriobacteriales bacterium]|nr:ATP phosphoribosyltransferase [Coriobacteriales bacterium]
MALSTPRGMRDILPDEALWRENIGAQVTRCFADAGYKPVETPLLEQRDLIDPTDLSAEHTFRLFDRDGSMLMLRPDVTLPIARMVSARMSDVCEPVRLRYTAPVFTEKDALRGEARQFTQLGIELIGDAGVEADAEVLLLMDKALTASGLTHPLIALGSVQPMNALLEASNMPQAWCTQVREACRDNNMVALDELVDSAKDQTGDALAYALKALVRVQGGPEAIAQARALIEPLGCVEDCGFDGLDYLVSHVTFESELRIDFSLMGSFGYYSGIVCAAYAPGLGACLGSGGRYDHVFERYGAPRPAAGFALSLDTLQLALDKQSLAQNRPLRVAISKGSLFKDAVSLLDKAGYDVKDLADPGRQLTIMGPDNIEYIIVRATDAPAFVAFGGADCGICGKDSLFEANLDVMDLVNLDFGACRFVVAEPDGTREQVEENYRRLGAIRVATKYPRITRAYYASHGIAADILKFHGNIELAPLVGMADRIVDITATGTTLRENNLVVVDEVMQCTAHLFANPASARTDPRVYEFAKSLKAAVTK